MARDELEGQEAEHTTGQPVENAPLAAAGSTPTSEDDGEESATPRDGSALAELEEIAQPRDPSVLRESGADAEGSWEEPPTAPASKAQGRYTPPPGKRGRKPDPASPRALRTYEEWKLRASASSSADERAAARAFGLAVMEGMRSRGEHLKADEFGRREGFLVEAAPAPPAPALGSTPGGPHPSQQPPAAAAAGPQAPAGTAPPAAPAAPRGPRIYGQPVERVKAALHSVSPAVDVLAGLAGAWGVDLSQPTKRTFFKGKPHQAELEITPRERLAEILAAKLCARAEEATLVGEDSDEDENTDLELLMLLGTTLGPAAVALGKRVLGTCVTGASTLFQMLRRRRR